MALVLEQAKGENWSLYNGDCIDIMQDMPSNSIHYSIFSPPFSSLYTFSDKERDISNSKNYEIFSKHYAFVIDQLFRILKPGRLISIHVMDLPTFLGKDGYIGMRDFPGDNIRICQQAGFIYHSRVTIFKDPVIAMQRTKAIGLLHKQLVKDAAMSRMGIADYIITMRKPGENSEPVAGHLQEYCGNDKTDTQLSDEAIQSWEMGGSRSFEQHKSILIWQRYASPVWMDINQSDTLSFRYAREENDERHISPLQIMPVQRCIQLWTNPTEIIFSPFAGIGTAGYVAVQQRRKFIGAELKTSYYKQAVINLERARKINKTFVTGDEDAAN